MKPRSGILVVDDTIDTLKAIVATLSAEGYAVRPVTGGQQALDAIQFQLPELILLDMRMPGIDGFEVCRRIQSDELLKTIPVLFLSSTGETEERLKGFAVGGVDFIPKPFQREELLARVHAHLELSRFRSRLEEQVNERTEHLRLANEQVEVELAERKLAERALRLSEEKYRHIVVEGPIGVGKTSLAQR
ncbi:MAG: response regulator, partial [Fibrobacterota bacterium]